MSEYQALVQKVASLRLPNHPLLQKPLSQYRSPQFSPDFPPRLGDAPEIDKSHYHVEQILLYCSGVVELSLKRPCGNFCPSILTKHWESSLTFLNRAHQSGIALKFTALIHGHGAFPKIARWSSKTLIRERTLQERLKCQSSHAMYRVMLFDVLSPAYQFDSTHVL
ncbi:unknown protein [Microcystis aeruginosa NIES-843]|uniref:Uncharacterized protein n=1 Tax=Microcystis aeruginosa (strain NIES-843 / IAM M-2473) TaxID=449447 RepID=B0JIH8_MICAN|nr:unknown protein [Microcystis aeruginosa NIES-843]